MKKILIFFSFCLLGSTLVSQSLENTLLWKVEGNGIKPSYIFGTFHLLPQKDFLLKDKVKKAFEETELVYMELDIDDPTLQRRMLNSSRFNNSQTLEDYLNPEEAEKLDQVLNSSLELSLSQVNDLKPFMVASMIIPSLIDETPASYERSLLQMALDQDKEVKGLEKVEYQVSIFDQIPFDLQIKDLMDMVEQKTAMKLIFDEMIQSYQDEDIDEIFSLTKTFMNNKVELELLVVARNKEWVPMVKDFSSKESIFYAVGAAHLGGKEGLINLLKSSGLNLTPIK